jgi:D-3-phosphoglycerate dehydrogenase
MAIATHIENKALVLDLVEWVACEPRPYAEVMDAWRTSCPRLPIWEDANAHGLVRCDSRDGRTMVEATAAGRALLRDAGRTPS